MTNVHCKNPDHRLHSEKTDFSARHISRQFYVVGAANGCLSMPTQMVYLALDRDVMPIGRFLSPLAGRREAVKPIVITFTPTLTVADIHPRNPSTAPVNHHLAPVVLDGLTPHPGGPR